MRIDHHIKTSAALALTLGAIGAPAASASSGSTPIVRPNADEQTIYAPASTASRAVLPNPDHQIAATTGTSGGPGSEVSDSGGYDFANVPPSIVHVSSPSGSFDWGDAGIGAAGGVALSVLALGGALAVTQRRRERPGRGSARAAG